MATLSSERKVVRDCVPTELYLQKQIVSSVCPVGHALLIPG